MTQAMTELIAGGQNGDTLIITYSGHGTYQPDIDGDEVDGLDEALCPYDIQTRGAALTDDEIRVIFANRQPFAIPGTGYPLPGEYDELPANLYITMRAAALSQTITIKRNNP